MRFKKQKSRSALEKDSGCCCPRRDFAQKAKFRGGILVTRAYIKESTYSWNIQSVSICLNRGCEEWVGNHDCAPASTRWLGWRQDHEGTAWVDFVQFIVQLYFDTHLRCALSVTFCGAVVLKVMDQKTLVKRKWSYKVRIAVYIYFKHLESLPDTSSHVFDWKPCQTLFLSPWPE